MKRILIDKIERDLQNLRYGLPWKYDATCFNFRPAKELVHVSEIDSIKKKDVESLIIGCDLEDYSFISDMTNLKQLYIYSGQNITELDFVKNLVNLTQLFIADSKVESVEGVVELLKKKARIIDEAKPIGFCMDKEKKEESSVKQKATAEDFVKFGLIPEVVGRLPVIAELEKLTVEDMKKILTDSEESFMNGYHSLMSELGVELVVQDDAIEEIAKMAYDRGVGARGISAIVENIMGDIVFEVPSDPTIKKCVINKEVVTEKESPYLVHTGGRKNSRKKNQKKMAS